MGMSPGPATPPPGRPSGSNSARAHRTTARPRRRLEMPDRQSERNSRNVLAGSDEYYDLMLGRRKADQQRKSNHYKWSETKATKVMAPWLEAKDTADENREVQKRHAVKDERHYIDQLHLKQQRRYRAQAHRLMGDLHGWVTESAVHSRVLTKQQRRYRAQAHRLMGDLH